MHTDTETNTHHERRFSATINDQTIHFTDPVQDARTMLESANYNPADDCILIRVLAHGTLAIGLDEKVDLREPGIETFWAFRADRAYRFTVDERGFDWGDATIKEPMLRAIAHVDDDDVIVLEKKDQPDQDLGPEDQVHLADAGTEHLRVEKRLVTVFFKNKQYEIPRGVYTTEQLIAMFPIEPGYLLNLKTDDGELVTLKPGQKICVKNGMQFYSQVPGGGSS
jgi:hypothetical protein